MNDANLNWESGIGIKELGSLVGNIPIEKMPGDGLNRNNLHIIVNQLKGIVDQVKSSSNANSESLHQFKSGDNDPISLEFDARALLKQRQLFIEGEQLSEAVNGYANIVNNLLKMGRGTGLKTVQRTLLNMYEPLSKAIAQEITAIETGVMSKDRLVISIILFM